MKEKKYCKVCGQALKEPIPIFNPETYYEFKDGFYCPQCAKKRVDTRRKQSI